MGIIFGLLAAVTYGASDFTGGIATRRASAITVVVFSQCTGLLLLAAALPFTWGGGPTTESLRWGTLAGLAGGAGVTLLYRGLAIGRMSVVAPVTALLAAALPVVIGLFTGERPSALAAAGVAVALVAIVLVSSAGEEAAGGPAHARPRLLARPGLREALGSGTGFGLFFALLGQAEGTSPVWPLLATKASSFGLLLVLAMGRGSTLRPPPGTLPLMLAAGALDISANASFLLATRASLLSLASVLTSLYPATTILCARLFLGERLGTVQRIGLVAAAAGVVLITLG